MNGRVYDPLIGRFGAPDPMTELPYSTQGWNRYAYVGNSPLNFTDPSGYCFAGCFWQKPFKALGKLLRRTPIVGQLLTVAAGFVCGPICSTLTSAAVAGLASGDLGQALKAGLISAATAIAFNVAGDLTGSLSGVNLDGTLNFLSEAHVFNMATHAAVGCGSAVASGGECGSGALSGTIGSFATPLTNDLSFGGGLIVTTTAGGLASVAGGGKFGNGAVTAAFGYMYNNCIHRGGCRTRAWESGDGSGVNGAAGYGMAAGGSTLGAYIGSQLGALRDWLLGASPSGTATIYQDGSHVSISVTSAKGSLHTEQLVLDDKMTTIVRADGSGTPAITINLPNADAALVYSQGMIGQNNGLYNARTNSCVTYCGNVLRAGGLEVPKTTGDIIRHLKGLQ